VVIRVFFIEEEMLSDQKILHLQYSTIENDLINQQLYFLSQDENFTKQRKKEKYRIIALSIVCGGVLLIDQTFSFLPFYFFGSAILFFIIYPWWSKWFYKRIIKTRVINKQKDIFPQDTIITFGEDFINVTFNQIETSIPFSHFFRIIEIPDYFFILTSNYPIINIPKNQITDSKYASTYLKDYCESHGISFVADNNYKWK